MLRAVIHASEVLVGDGVRMKDGRKIVEGDLGAIRDGAVVYSFKKAKGREIPGEIKWVGRTADLPGKYSRVPKTDLKNRFTVVPGFIDCHTHLVFAGNRAEEFALRCGGTSYEEIARRGGGILTTVNATRSATLEELVELGKKRVEEAASYGVRTIEVKSGYGLSAGAELKQLEAVKALQELYPEMTLVPTFLGAHAFPKDRSRKEYLDEIVDVMLPQVAKRKLAQACDVFVDQGYFTIAEARRILAKAKRLGLKTKVHADELANTESAAFAASIDALSADHLLQVSAKGIRALAKSDTVAVILPGTAFYLKASHAPARELIDAGATVAISTDFNPGTCMTLNLPAVLTIAALYLGMTRAELFASVTYSAAKALGLHGRKGTLEPGMDADLAILPFKSFEECYYRFAWSS